LSDEYGVKMAAIPPDAVVDETGLTIAFVRVDAESGDVTVHWLPSLFSRPMPAPVREAITEKLRFHADMLENGTLERDMQKFAAINNRQNRSERTQ
jgi:hypothetical protein